MVVAKKDSKSLDVNCRHSSVLTGMDRHKMSTSKKNFLRLVRVHNLFLANNDEESALAIRGYIEQAIGCYKEASTVPQRTYVRYAGGRLRLNSELIDDALIGANYRFESRDQLRRLYVGFKIPAFFTIPDTGYRFNGEELLLISIERCALGSRLLDLQMKYHVQHTIISRGINFFTKWMNDNWGYLLRDNLDFWRAYLEGSVMAIRKKMLTQYDFDVDEIQNDFKVAMFIDCTMIRSERSGGGPIVPGPFAPRYPFIVQEAFYNGFVVPLEVMRGPRSWSEGRSDSHNLHVISNFCVHFYCSFCVFSDLICHPCRFISTNLDYILLQKS
jgi:hypothetical protein